MEATVVYPHQLFADSPAVTAGRRVYLVEEPLILTTNPIHRQKLIVHKLTLDAYERELTSAGHEVIRLDLDEFNTTESVFERLSTDHVQVLHIVDTTDDYLERAIEAAEKSFGFSRRFYDSPLFILTKQEACERFINSGRYMATFYRKLRQDLSILLDDTGKPVGGTWSFDKENRKKLPNDIKLPDDSSMYGNAETKAAEAWAEDIEAEQYGQPGCWLPYTRAGAEKFLEDFLRTRFATFGPYEDALSTRSLRLFHSTLSPLLNLGLLTAQDVLNEALAYGLENDVPINSLEGFIRQLLGWREFMRASYEVDGRKMRQQNFFKHERKLPYSFWTGTTDVAPVDHVIQTALTYGYNHHIERLMVMGNFMLLSQIHPDEVYRWFMGLYLDAYDWVMVPNVYGMSQFADGGSFATKPYISGANYIKKMSDYEGGDWEDLWTALYWNFINKHKEVFENNHRLSMMPKTLERMKEETRERHMDIARKYLTAIYK